MALALLIVCAAREKPQPVANVGSDTLVPDLSFISNKVQIQLSWNLSFIMMSFMVMRDVVISTQVRSVDTRWIGNDLGSIWFELVDRADENQQSRHA